ncbi:large ribosomal subunit protein bL32m-like [Glandiceps talaboti]
MAAHMLATRLRLVLQNLESKLRDVFPFHPPIAPALAVTGSNNLQDKANQTNTGFDIKSLWNGILWAVPKSKRSLERRRTRRRAFEKRIHPRQDIIPCEVCGQPKLMYHLCGHCVQKVRTETEAIREKLGEEWHWNIPQTETLVLYEGESVTNTDKNKHIVEMKKKRPSWFSKELYEERKS